MVGWEDRLPVARIQGNDLKLKDAISVEYEVVIGELTEQLILIFSLAHVGSFTCNVTR